MSDQHAENVPHDSDRSPYKKPRPLHAVDERWIEECRNPELRAVERPGWKDLYAVATMWDQDTGLPIEEYTWWHGDKGDFFSLWYAVLGFVEFEHADLLAELVARETGESPNGSGSRD